MKEKKSSYFTATWKMLAAVIIGGIAGGVSVVIYELMKKGIDAGIRTINGTIQQYIFPALIIIAVVTVVVGEYSLYRLKNVYKEMKDADVIAVPLLGKITAGSPIEAIEQPNEYFSLPAYLVPNNKDVFTLRVSGTSMINVGILDDDIVIVQRQSVARNGEIIVAMTDENEVTLKTYYKEDGYFRLQPENNTMPV